ncbi:MAG: type II secretion system protein GspJ [bacterium]
MLAGGRRQAGMTLVEILVALSVSSLILVAAVSVYRTMTGSLHRQQSRRLEPAYAVLEQLRQDLSQCAQVPSSNIPAFILKSVFIESNAPQQSVLAFSRGHLPSPESDFSGMEVMRLRYSLISSGAGPAGALVRESQSLWGSNALAPAVSNTLLEHVTAFEVSVLSESGWTNNWESSSRTLLPRAARLRMDWETGAQLDSTRLEVFIPAGNVVPGSKPVP